LTGDNLKEFTKLNIPLQKGDFVSPAPFKLNPAQQNTVSAKKYSYEDFMATE
jgi:hypothetical protein